MRIRFAELNHILIPATKAGRDRLRKKWYALGFRQFEFFYNALSDEGKMVMLLALVVGAFGLDVRTTDVYVLFSGLVGLLVGSLWARRAFDLRDVSIGLVGPSRITQGSLAEFTVRIENRSDVPLVGIRVRGPFLPWDGRWEASTKTLHEVRPRETKYVSLSASFSHRGEHHLDSFQVSRLVPLGLALGGGQSTEGHRFMVVPKVCDVVSLSLVAGRRYQPGGVRLASKTGESTDLLGVRPYRFGDRIRDLHARSWARHGEPAVREYQEEYFTRVGVLLRTHGAKGDDHFEALLELAAGIVHCLSRGEALIDLLVVDGRIHDLTVGRSLGFAEQALDLLSLVDRPEHAKEDDAFLAKLEPYARRLSSMLILSLTEDDGPLRMRMQREGVHVETIVLLAPGTEASASHVKSVTVRAVREGGLHL